MKPFNIEEAKAGKPVQDRYGQPVKILKYDLIDNEWPIVGVCTTNNGREYINVFKEEELFMTPEEKTLYLNIYPDGNSYSHSSREHADCTACADRVARVKVTFTEGQYDE